MTLPLCLSQRAFRPEAVAESDLPEGVIGRVEGFALVYDTLDTFGTAFGPGSLERTKRERVAAGKVKLFWDHGDSPSQNMYDTDLHIGVVRSLETRKTPDGKLGEWMVADLFDTAEARKAKDYLRAVLAAGGETGLSIGMKEKGLKIGTARVEGATVPYFTEVPLKEISITAEQSVPGCEVATVRMEDRHEAMRVTLRGIIAQLGIDDVRAALASAEAAQEGNAHEQDSPDAVDTDTGDAEAGDSRAVATPLVTMAERQAAVRASYSRGWHEGFQEPGGERVSRPGGRDPQRAA